MTQMTLLTTLFKAFPFLIHLVLLTQHAKAVIRCLVDSGNFQFFRDTACFEESLGKFCLYSQLELMINSQKRLEEGDLINPKLP